MKSTLGLNSRINETGQISELEHRMVEIMEAEKNRERMKRKKGPSQRPP